jgi:SAM-dependent methyltransferase
VIKGDLFSARFPDRFFDVVTLYHVLEHTPDPLEICREVHRILKEDGFLVIQVPNRDSLQYRIFKKRWAAFDVPRDLYYFGAQTLRALVERSGFVIQRTDPFMNWWHPPTLVLSLFPSLDPQKAWQKEGKGQATLFQRIAWILLTLTVGPLTWGESRMSHGAIITAYATKEK